MNKNSKDLRILYKYNEYWLYLIGGKSNYCSIGNINIYIDGLLYIIFDFIKRKNMKDKDV